MLTAFIFLFLPDYPDSPQGRRQFLTLEEGKFIVDRLPPNSPRQSDANFNWADVRAACKDPLTYGFSFILLCQQTGIAGVSFLFILCRKNVNPFSITVHILASLNYCRLRFYNHDECSTT